MKMCHCKKVRGFSLVENTKYILGVDQSLACTGYVLLSPDGDLWDYGCIKTSKTDGDLYTRCKIVSNTLRGLLDTHFLDVESVVLAREGLAFGGSKSNASRDLAVLVGHIESTFNAGAFFQIAPTSLKKYATGRGGAKKSDMIMALPENVKEDFMKEGYKKSTGLADLADAYFIAKYVIPDTKMDAEF